MPILLAYDGRIMSARPVRNISARRAARHPKASFLIAADEHTFAELEALVALLPLCASGRIFIEVPDASHIGTLQAPSRMTVTWLDRSRRGDAAVPGQALVRAVTAWSDEMMCDAEDDTRVHLLTGYVAAVDIAEHLVENVGVGADRVHATIDIAR